MSEREEDLADIAAAPIDPPENTKDGKVLSDKATIDPPENTKTES